MRLGLQLGYDDPVTWTALAEEAERCGFHSVWTSEAYGSDAVSPLAWIGSRTTNVRLGTAIMQMPARSPATTAATVATLDLLSGGRVLLGLGTSGPQVAEGWHGQAWGKPLTRTREYVEIVRAILRREAPLEHHGEHYDIPYSGPRRDRAREAAADHRPPAARGRADLPRRDRPEERRARGGDRGRLAADLLLARALRARPTCRCSRRASRGGAAGPRAGTSPRTCPSSSPTTSPPAATSSSRSSPSTSAGMGAKGKNFYTRLAERYGYADAAATIQDLYLAGKKNEAIAAVPDALVDEVALVGDRARIGDRLAAFRECGVGTLILQARQPEALRLLAELA